MSLQRLMLFPVAAAAVFLAACVPSGDSLMNFRQDGNGPDEFSIVPTKPLETPGNLAYLPEPIPGGENRVDQKPRHDAVAALGGRAGLLDTTTVRSGEQSLIAAVGRFGVDPSIRARLAAEDEAFRSNARVRPLERIFNVNVYFDVYEDETLDAHEELRRLRRLGVRTPTAPPAP